MSMKSELLLEAVGETKDSLLERLEKEVSRQNKIRKQKFSAAAAVFLVLLSAAIIIPLQTDRTPENDVSGGAEGEIGKQPQWEEMTLYEKYPYLEYKDVTYHAVGETEAGLKSESTGFILEGEEPVSGKLHQINAQIYEMAGIAPECAVAVRIEGASKYYAYINPYYQPETLGDMITDLNLPENLQFGTVWYRNTAGNGDSGETEYTGLTPEAVWEILLSDETAVIEEDYDSREFIAVMSISIDIPALGYSNISLGVTQDGYLITNILDSGKAFRIGTEKTEQFIHYVQEQCKEVQTQGNESGIPMDVPE